MPEVEVDRRIQDVEISTNWSCKNKCIPTIPGRLAETTIGKHHVDVLYARTPNDKMQSRICHLNHSSIKKQNAMKVPKIIPSRRFLVPILPMRLLIPGT